MEDRGWKWVALLSLLGFSGLAYFIIKRQGELLRGPPAVYIFNGPGPFSGQGALAASTESPRPKRLRKLDKLVSKLEVPISNNLLQSYELPVLGSTTSAVRVCQALETSFDVVLRVVGPPGSLAVFAPNPTDLDIGTAAVPVGNTLIVPAGTDHRIHLTPHQVLYAKGTLAGVIISVNATEAAVRSLV